MTASMPISSLWPCSLLLMIPSRTVAQPPPFSIALLLLLPLHPACFKLLLLLAKQCFFSVSVWPVYMPQIFERELLCLDNLLLHSFALLILIVSGISCGNCGPPQPCWCCLYDSPLHVHRHTRSWKGSGSTLLHAPLALAAWRLDSESVLHFLILIMFNMYSHVLNISIHFPCMPVCK